MYDIYAFIRKMTGHELVTSQDAKALTAAVDNLIDEIADKQKRINALITERDDARRSNREARAIISATHKRAVTHQNCQRHSCPICEGGLFQCADCGAVEIETEQRVCTCRAAEAKLAGGEADRSVAVDAFLLWAADVHPEVLAEAERLFDFNLGQSSIKTTLTHPAPTHEDGSGKPVAAFGHGTLIVDTGTAHGQPAVFIRPSPVPGHVGEKTRDEHKGPLDRLVPGEIFMTFPTDEQARRVADALCNAALSHTSGEVTDKMVDTFKRAYQTHLETASDGPAPIDFKAVEREAVRVALEAALRGDAS